MTQPERDVRTGLPPIHESLVPREHAMHRPRHGRRQRTALTCALIFFFVPALAFVFGVRPQAFENHRLAAFPSLAAGWTFFTGLSDWATDHLPLRQYGVQAESRLSQSVFGEPPAFSGSDRQSAGAPVGPIAVPAPQQSSPPINSGIGGNSQIVVGRDGWLYYAQDMSAKCTPAQPLTTTVAALSDLRSAVESSGRSLVLVVAPDKSTAVPQFLPDSYPNKNCAAAAADPFWTAVVQTGGALDLRPALHAAAVQRGGPVYYPQDTHWTDLGSLAMLRTVADHIQPGVTNSWRSLPGGIVDAGADLPPMIGMSGTDLDARYTLSPDGRGDRTGQTYADMPNPVRFLGKPTTGMITEPVALLGDSFLAHASRYLPAVFSNATAIDYATLDTQAGAVESVMASGRVVVVEVVERELAAGVVPFLQPQVIAGIRSYLAAHPAP